MGNAVAQMFHILGFVTWLSGLFFVARTLSFRQQRLAAGDTAVAEALGAWARKTARVADIGATLAILAGLHLLFAAKQYMFLHVNLKVALAVVVIGIHGYLRVQAKKAAQGQATSLFPVLPVLAVVVATMVFLVRLGPFYL